MNLETSLASIAAAATAEGPELAHCASFSIGVLEVVPARREVRAPGGETRQIQPLAMRVLMTLKEAHPQTCSRDDLIRSCWSQRIVGDDALHRVISTLRRDLTGLSSGSVGITTIAKVGYRLRFEPEAAAESDRLAGAGAASGKGLRRFWPVAAAVVVALLTTGVLATRSGGPDTTTIAVVGDAAGRDASFANGLTGDLARLASAMPMLAFVEPGATGAQEPLVLRVALDTQDGLPSARLRLVDREGGSVVWSREFAAKSGTLAELRENVANGVAGVVQCGLDRSAAFDDPVGLRLYLGACEGLATGDFARAREFAHQITAYRPNSPAGWACLANTTIFAEAESGKMDPEVLARAEGYAQRALAADATSGLAYVALAMAASWRGEPVLEILERGIRADPDFALLHKHYAQGLMGAGMMSQAVDPALRAVALQPHDHSMYRTAVGALQRAGRIEEAQAMADTMQRLWRYDASLSMRRIDLMFHASDPKAALAASLASPVRARPNAAILFEALEWRADPQGYDWSRFDRAARAMAANNPNDAWAIAHGAARMGDRERALAWLERAPSQAHMAWTPLFGSDSADLRRDVRFFDKMARVGLAARWQKSGRWPDFCRDPGLGYDCRRRATELALIESGKAENGGRTRART